MSKLSDYIGKLNNNIVISDRDPTSADDGLLWYNTTTKTMFFKTPTGWETKTLNFSYRGVWNSTDTYSVNDIVSYNNGVYIAIAANTNKQPDMSPDVWELWFSLPNLSQVQAIRDEVFRYRDEVQALVNDVQTTYTNTINEINGLENLARALQQVGANFFYIDANGHLIANYSDPIINVSLDANRHLIIEY